VSRPLERLALGLLLLAAGTGSAWPHVAGNTGYAVITISRSTVRYRLTLPAAALPPELAEALRLAQSGLPQSTDQLLDLVRRHIVLRADDTRCEPGPGQLLPQAPDARSIGVQVDFACGAPVRRLAITDNLFDVLGQDYHTLAKVESAEGAHQLAFEPTARDARVVLEEPGSGRARGASFFRLGVEHILTGYDHLLFLAALLLRGGRFWSLLKIVTAFTIAHSVTLALAVLGVVAVPERLVESAIALSIVWVALENLARAKAPSRRWLVSFAFGLVHGFGFASALRPLSLPAARLAWALFGFNLGVEAGQAMVVLLLLPVLVWMHGKPWEHGAVRAASLAVAAVGLTWFVQRVFFA